MSLMNLKRKYIGSSVDSLSDSLTRILESVDPLVRQEGRQLFQHFLLELIRGNNLIKSFLDGVLASGLELPMFSSPMLLPTAQLLRLIIEFVRSNERNEVQEVLRQWTCHYDLGTALAGLSVNTEDIEEMLATLFYLCQVVVQGRQNRDENVLWPVVDRCQQILWNILYPHTGDMTKTVETEDNKEGGDN
ncbi:hypothetical protein Btru_036537 [Bulinus truncatus]|nr:hypothetical protein Btru_036537 [Bulinus truncatus]